jgi:anti-anti-sigma factor
MAQLTIQEARREGTGRAVLVLALSGDLDAHTFPGFQERLERAVADGARAIVIDCAALAYVSSAGLGVLKRMVKEVRADGGDIRLAALSEKIRNVMNLLGFSKIIQVFSTVDEAVDSY